MISSDLSFFFFFLATAWMIIQSVSDPRGSRWFLLKGRHNSSCNFKAVVLPENEWTFKMRQIIRPEGWDFSFCWIEMTQIDTHLVCIWHAQSHIVLCGDCQGVCEAAIAMVTMCCMDAQHTGLEFGQPDL